MVTISQQCVLRSGGCRDFEGRFPDPKNNQTWVPRATVPQFAATWDIVSHRLHEHGKTIAVCIGDANKNSSNPNMTEVVYTSAWAYTNYIPFVDSITDMSTYYPVGDPTAVRMRGLPTYRRRLDTGHRVC